MVKPIVRDVRILRQANQLVVERENISGIIKDLEDTFAALKGYGLTAPQIGVQKQVAIVRLGNFKIDLINSKITDKQEPFRFKGESCFSFPGLKIDTRRYAKIWVRNAFSDEVKEYQGLIAVVLQHEIDHCHGVVILDRVWRGR